MGLTTRCKFRCTTVTLNEGGSKTVKLTAVYPDKDVDGYEHGEDHAFFNATPYAHVEMTIQNPAGAEMFQPGDHFYADFSKVLTGD
jgi:hypothetical protein